MSRGNYKPLDPRDIDSSLTRVVVHQPGTFLMFPFIDGRGSEPKFTSISVLIRAEAASAKDFSALVERVAAAAEGATWYLNFNTPWLLGPVSDDDARPVAAVRRSPRSGE